MLHRCCLPQGAGAEALGISAVRITRGALDGEMVPGIRSLREVEPMIGARP